MEMSPPCMAAVKEENPLLGIIKKWVEYTAAVNIIHLYSCGHV